MEDNWRRRMGEAVVTELKVALAAVISGFSIGPPDCMPILGYGLTTPAPFSESDTPWQDEADARPLVAMLARVLLALTLDHERAAGLSLTIGANVLRLATGDGVLLGDLPRAAGISREGLAMATGYLEKRAMATITSGGRRRVLRLTFAGAAAKARYEAQTVDVEARWRDHLGASHIDRLRGALDPMVTGEGLESLLGGLTTTSGWRAGVAPANLPWQPMVLHRGGHPDGA